MVLTDKLIAAEDRQHTPKQERPHVAQEYRDLGHHEASEDLVQHLLPWAQNCALGVSGREGVQHAT